VEEEPSALELAHSLGRDAMNREDIDYRLVVDSTPALVFSARPDGYVDYFNLPGHSFP
jgi:PAS domain-containing protein